LTPGLASGVYAIDGDLILTGSDYTFTGGNFVILVNGNLYINEKIFVNIGSTLVISTSGNITVSSAVGETAGTSCTTTSHLGCSIEGLYSADNYFYTAPSLNPSCGATNRLNIAGSVIANAGRRGGSFVNYRTLCSNNSTYPAVSFVERPDFMLNYPSVVTQTTRSWQDIPPSAGNF